MALVIEAGINHIDTTASCGDWHRRQIALQRRVLSLRGPM
jgi:hypothetical protein